jgi:hypothetical protein
LSQRRKWRIQEPALADLSPGAGGRRDCRKGEKGTTVCYADRFTPKAEEAQARGGDREARTVTFHKRLTVFNVDQCDGLPEDLTIVPELPDEEQLIPAAEALIRSTGADLRIGGDMLSMVPASTLSLSRPRSPILIGSTDIARRPMSLVIGRVIRAGSTAILQGLNLDALSGKGDASAEEAASALLQKHAFATVALDADGLAQTPLAKHPVARRARMDGILGPC